MTIQTFDGQLILIEKCPSHKLIDHRAGRLARQESIPRYQIMGRAVDTISQDL